VVAMIVQFSFLGELQPLLQLPLLLILALQWKLHPDDRKAWTWGLYFLQVVGTLVLLYKFDSRFLFVFSSALLLGVTHYAMLLGHYYLVVPKLTEKPLLVSLRLFWSLILPKIVWSLLSIFEAPAFFEEGTILGDGFLFNWIVASMRWLWGYVALLVLSYFAWRLCRMRSIQSATGVLYIMVFFVFVGELLSNYFYLKFGIAL
jgi:hypothetical protein